MKGTNINIARTEATIKYYDMEEVNIKGFCAFCKSNAPLLFAVSIMLFFTYGIRLFWHSIGIDTELFMAHRAAMDNWHLSIGRFGLVLLQRVWHIEQFNPFTAFFTAFCLIWFFTISWCYIISIFNRNTGRNNKLIPFALVFMTMPVWAEQFYHLLQVAENAFIISLTPYIIYLLYKGFLDNEKGKIACASVLLVFVTAVYQPIVLLFCCGIFCCFVLLSEKSNYEPRVYRMLCLKLFVTLLGCFVIYFGIDRILIPAVFAIERASYLDANFQWGQRSISEILFRILTFGYIITIGHIPLVQEIANPFIASYASQGAHSVEIIAIFSRVLGNILLLPVSIFFLARIFSAMYRTIPAGRRLLYMLAGVGIPLTILLLPITMGGIPALRTLYSLPLAFAFMSFFIMSIKSKRAATIIACLVLLVAVYQAQTTAQLFYSDQMRYNEDVRFAHLLYNEILQVQPDGGRLPVALIGRHVPAPRFHSNFLQGQMLGTSFWGWTTSPYFGKTTRGLAFMRTLGINLDIIDDGQLQDAFQTAKVMPIFPAPGSVKHTENFIVVRLSETLY